MIVTPVSRVAGHDRALDRRRAAPPRQQRGVHVEQQMLGEQRLADQLPERAHRPDVRAAAAIRSTASGSLTSAVWCSSIAQIAGGAATGGGSQRARGLGGCRDASRRAPTMRESARRRSTAPRTPRSREDRRVSPPPRAPARPPQLGAEAVPSPQRAQRPLALLALRALEHQHPVEVVDLVLDHPRPRAPTPRRRAARPREPAPSTRTCSGRSTSTITREG